MKPLNRQGFIERENRQAHRRGDATRTEQAKQQTLTLRRQRQAKRSWS